MRADRHGEASHGRSQSAATCMTTACLWDHNGHIGQCFDRSGTQHMLHASTWQLLTVKATAMLCSHKSMSGQRYLTASNPICTPPLSGCHLRAAALCTGGGRGLGGQRRGPRAAVRHVWRRPFHDRPGAEPFRAMCTCRRRCAPLLCAGAVHKCKNLHLVRHECSASRSRAAACPSQGRLHCVIGNFVFVNR